MVMYSVHNNETRGHLEVNGGHRGLTKSTYYGYQTVLCQPMMQAQNNSGLIRGLIPNPDETRGLRTALLKYVVKFSIDANVKILKISHFVTEID